MKIYRINKKCLYVKLEKNLLKKKNENDTKKKLKVNTATGTKVDRKKRSDFRKRKNFVKWKKKLKIFKIILSNFCKFKTKNVNNCNCLL